MSEEKQFDEYPKMLTVKRKDARGFIREVPIMRDGQPVIFNDPRELKNYDGKGTPHDGRPEQHSHPSYSYTYSPFATH